MKRKNENETMQASGTAVMDAPVEQVERDNSYTQGGDDNDETVEDNSNDVAAPTGELAAISAFRQYCIDNPNVIHEFDLAILIADPKRNGRLKERTVKDPSVKELAQAIIARGKQLTPGEVTLGLDEKLYITAGTGRYLAIGLVNSTRSKADQLPFRATVLIETADAPELSAIDNAMENWFRLDLGPLDKAKIVADFMSEPLKLNRQEVSKKLGIPKSSVSVYCTMNNFSDQVKQWIADGKITVKAVYELAVVDPAKVEEQAKKLIDASGGKKVTTQAYKKKKGGKASEGDGEDETTGKGGKKVRTTKQILTFVNDEATPATAKKYGDKNLEGKLKCIAAFVGGGREETFLKNLAAL